ncbi:MAG TPA: alkaline phosphatase D family protein [Bryobacteraceae bacterium]|nr:alkaline phosphatase D family protein [Bryobacteraceae bacterium]
MNGVPSNRALLGPIVGHTDHQGSIIWVRVKSNPHDFALRLHGRSTLIPFVSTEAGPVEFGTAVATVGGLRPEHTYTYQVMHRGRAVAGARGSFRTMPPPGSAASLSFITLSCSDAKKLGAWQLLQEYIETFEPHFVLMIGDQIYMDGEAETSVWDHHLDSPPQVRRRAMVEMYQEHWDREPVKTILANTPTYMVWDDHDIRDGWGSWAGESPTLQAKYPRGAPITEQYSRYFDDARDIYWHFQMTHNPPPLFGPSTPPVTGERRAMPFAFRCGRLAVLLVDSRGERDVFRPDYPILGDRQWRASLSWLRNLPPSVDALACVTPVPIVAMDPGGLTQSLFQHRTDDEVLYREGRAQDLLVLQKENGSFLDIPFNLAGRALQANIGAYRARSIDDLRDQWSQRFSQPEQEAILRTIAQARFANRLPGRPRAAFFLGGDLHIGGRFEIRYDEPEWVTECMIASGISREENITAAQGIVVNESFEVAPGINAELKQYLRVVNFGVTQVQFFGERALVEHRVLHPGAEVHARVLATSVF